ncbi:hypothetical protein PENTCL1PPCAC_12645, partial [Pristionchus entomophagus]
MSTPESIVEPTVFCDIRIADASDYVTRKSLGKIETNLRSNDVTETTIVIKEKDRFDGRPTEDTFEADSKPFTLDFEERCFGSEFTFVVTEKNKVSQLVADRFQFVVKAELTVEETRKFLENAEMLVDPDSMRPARFYRNNFPDDETQLEKNSRGCYELVTKQCSGHRASPLFGKFRGVYLSCRLDEKDNPVYRQDTGLPEGFAYPKASPYGPNRRSFDTDKILKENSRLFLADMHCFLQSRHEEWYSRPHYPLLIVCQKDSATYNECGSMGLVELDWEDNNFLLWQPATGQLMCSTEINLQRRQMLPHNVWPEIFLCDTELCFKDGLKSRCDLRESSPSQRSFYRCNACHGNRRKVNRESSRGDGESRKRQTEKTDENP